MRDYCAIAGAVLLSIGAGLAWLPLGLMVAGGLLLAAAVYGQVRGMVPTPPAGN